jgi:hypothetical protein
MLLGGPQIVSCGPGLGWTVVDRRDWDGFWGRVVDAGGCGRAAGRRVAVVGCGWARVDDVSKRRRQGLVVCRATCPFEGLIYARPGVTLAPTFAGLLACQSRTIRV